MLPAFLYVGVDSATAKMAPIHGLPAPVILTDVYAGNMGFYSLTRNGPIGVVQIDTNILVQGAFKPFPNNKKSRKQWSGTLGSCGLCHCEADIPRHAIVRVGVYDPFNAHSNGFINSVIADCDPRSPNPNHKSNYAKNMVITRWLSCEEIREEHMPKESARKLLTLSDNCLNRNALDLFYLRPEKEKWWRA